jgi:hypothetical protein
MLSNIPTTTDQMINPLRTNASPSKEIGKEWMARRKKENTTERAIDGLAETIAKIGKPVDSSAITTKRRENAVKGETEIETERDGTNSQKTRRQHLTRNGYLETLDDAKGGANSNSRGLGAIKRRMEATRPANKQTSNMNGVGRKPQEGHPNGIDLPRQSKIQNGWTRRCRMNPDKLIRKKSSSFGKRA